jgi:hypothetical protein
MKQPFDFERFLTLHKPHIEPARPCVAVEEKPETIEQTPYPWCPGNPTKQDCILAGYCRKVPSCGD